MRKKRKMKNITTKPINPKKWYDATLKPGKGLCEAYNPLSPHFIEIMVDKKIRVSPNDKSLIFIFVVIQIT